MSDDDLIERLNSLWRMFGGGGYPTTANTIILAKERIETLTAERDEAKAMQECGCAYENPTDICAGHHALFERVYGAHHPVRVAAIALGQWCFDNVPHMEGVPELLRDLDRALGNPPPDLRAQLKRRKEEKAARAAKEDGNA